MKLLYYSLALYLSLTSPTTAASSSKEDPVPDEPCTVTSPLTGNFFDLRTLALTPPAPDSKVKHPRDYSWNATGYDGYNFTINICSPVLEKVTDVEDVDEHNWRNVSAYYEYKGKTFSIGQQNSIPVMRGRKLVLNYTDGSLCPPPSNHGERHDVGPIRDNIYLPYTDDDDAAAANESRTLAPRRSSSSYDDDAPPRRKNTVISMLCNKDPLAAELTLSFVASPDECSYFFEARSPKACVTVNETKQALNPAGVFGVIALIAVLVYVVGGCVYSRVVLQQRGWRQLPNYGLWAGIFAFFKDLVLVLFASCARILPIRPGYARLNNGMGAAGRRGRGDSDAENRLIDELNEEWED